MGTLNTTAHENKRLICLTYRPPLSPRLHVLPLSLLPLFSFPLFPTPAFFLHSPPTVLPSSPTHHLIPLAGLPQLMADQKVVSREKILQGRGKVREFHLKSKKVDVFKKNQGKNEVI